MGEKYLSAIPPSYLLVFPYLFLAKTQKIQT